MERKYSEVKDFLSTCKRIPIKCSPNRIVVHNREEGFRYVAPDDPGGNTIAIVYFYLDAAEVQQESVRLLVIDGSTYTLEALALPS